MWFGPGSRCLEIKMIMNNIPKMIKQDNFLMTMQIASYMIKEIFLGKPVAFETNDSHNVVA